MQNISLFDASSKFLDKNQPPFFSFDYGNNISERKLKNVRKYYADYNSTEEQPMLLIDDTLFRSAKLGLLITNKYLYYRLRKYFDKWDMETGKIFLNDVMNLNIKTNNKGADLLINEKKVGCFRVLEAWGSKQKEADVLNRLFELIIETLHPR